jgi:hypothetical protein
VAKSKHNRFAAQLVAELSAGQRNHLRTLLSFETGHAALRDVLGLAGQPVITEAEHKIGLAKAGNTASLFDWPWPADLKASR